jgi:uncharacterized protein YprB with RNaseH-like and TPR domain
MYNNYFKGIQSFKGTSEAAILQNFINYLKAIPRGGVMITYNGQMFDIPVLILRSWVLNVDLLKELSKFVHFDVYQYMLDLKRKAKIRDIKGLKLRNVEQYFGFKHTLKKGYDLKEDVQGLMIIGSKLMGG